MELFNNRYRINSSRLPNWDYSANAVYFITICSYAKEHFFGDIQNKKMQLSPIGHLAHKFIVEIPKHFGYIDIDALVIMPNHIHVLIAMNHTVETLHCNVSHSEHISNKMISNDVIRNETLQCNVSTAEHNNKYMSQISPKKGSISTIVRSYKSIVTRESKKINPDFAWQERFHDHIVRNDTSYYKIKQYIKDNPKNWEIDKFY